MNFDHSDLRLSQRFGKLAEQCDDRDFTLADLLVIFGDRAHALVVLLITAPFALIPLPGLSAPFGLVVAISGLCIAFRLPMWLPKRLRDRPWPRATLKKIFATTAKFVGWFEGFVRPRLLFLCESGAMRVVAGLVIMASGLILALPLPPGTNFPPAIVGVFLSLAVLERDGVLMILGVLLFVLKILLAVSIFHYGAEFIGEMLR